MTPPLIIVIAGTCRAVLYLTALAPPFNYRRFFNDADKDNAGEESLTTTATAVTTATATATKTTAVPTTMVTKTSAGPVLGMGTGMQPSPKGGLVAGATVGTPLALAAVAAAALLLLRKTLATAGKRHRNTCN